VSITLCIVALRIGVQGYKLYLAGKFLFVRSDTFALGCIV